MELDSGHVRTNRCLQLVTSGHPNFDTSLLEVSDSLGDTILQFVFDGCRA